MASSAAAQAQGIHRQDVQVALAKAVELRALHAALFQGAGGSSPAILRLPGGASPSLSRASNQFSAEDYPVFTPSYEEEPLPGYRYIHPENRSLSENWSGIGLQGEFKDDEALNPDNKAMIFSSLDSEHNLCTADDHFSSGDSCINPTSIFQTAPGSELLKSGRRTNSVEFKTVTTCNKCKPATISRETDCDHMNLKNVHRTIPSTITQPPLQLHSKNRGPIFSWLFPKLKKKPKPEMSPNMMESEETSQILKEWGVFSLESLKKELLEANENRDAALVEVTEMRSSLGELKQKLVSLESYCEELKKSLKRTVQGRDTQALDKPNLSKRTKSISGSRENSMMPVSHEVMVEGFLQIVSEARLSVKQFCKTLINQIEETDSDLMEKLNVLLHPHQMTLNNKYSKGVLYHLEALINQSLFQDFENCVFQKNGAPKVLDPQQDRLENFSAFVALRNLSWNEVLQKGTKYYSEDFSRFCDQKMSCIISILNWSRPWPEQLLQSFFVSAKCIWLLHLLAFSFNPPLVILRVDGNRSFDPLYMEDMLLDRQQAQGPAQVKAMVMPGFYVQDRVLKCKVLCRYRSVP